VRQEISLTVNGVQRELRVDPRQTLLTVLRDELDLMSVRGACGVGMCGSCTVLVDSELMSGCLMLAVQAEGKDIVTVEGLSAAGGALHPVQQAFVECGGFQCSFCTPGFLLATKALLDEVPRPDDETIRAYLGGNICRCGSYSKIVQSVHRAAQLIEREHAAADGAGGPPRDDPRPLSGVEETK
jgi:carbon-monoxide dehydrogenase small subunit